MDVFNFENLPTPKLTVGNKRHTYIFGIYSASTQITTAFMWHELLTKQGCNDVISCLSHFILRTPLGRTGAKWSIVRAQYRWAYATRIPMHLIGENNVKKGGGLILRHGHIIRILRYITLHRCCSPRPLHGVRRYPLSNGLPQYE